VINRTPICLLPFIFTRNSDNFLQLSKDWFNQKWISMWELYFIIFSTLFSTYYF